MQDFVYYISSFQVTHLYLGELMKWGYFSQKWGFRLLDVHGLYQTLSIYLYFALSILQHRQIEIISIQNKQIWQMFRLDQGCFFTVLSIFLQIYSIFLNTLFATLLPVILLFYLNMSTVRGLQLQHTKLAFLELFSLWQLFPTYDNLGSTS